MATGEKEAVADFGRTAEEARANREAEAEAEANRPDMSKYTLPNSSSYTLPKGRLQPYRLHRRLARKDARGVR